MKVMTYNQAIAVALAAMERQAHRLAFEANLFLRGMKTPVTERSYRERKKLLDAMELLKESEVKSEYE